ncbi:MAG: hypothetical protein WBV63_04690 [Candidatus Sulfotelmatobacter sp.]
MDHARRLGAEMTGRVTGLGRVVTHAFLGAVVVFCCVRGSHAQGNGLERTFPQSKARVEKALQEMKPATAGRLPVLEGFATSGDLHLDRYVRGYYQAKFEVNAAPSGGSIVRVSVEVTAWYADPVAARSAYQVLTSNGRLEGDLLDQLADQIAGKGPLYGAAPANAAPERPFPSERSSSGRSLSGQTSGQAAAQQTPSGPSPSQQAMNTPSSAEPAISAPEPRLPETSGGLSPSMAEGLSEREKAGSEAGPKKVTDEAPNALRAEAESLEEVLKNQSHPKNLVAVKKSGTPVVATASLTAKTLFLASAHDEFEMLDFNRDWVHVRISGLSRGWIWRNSLEMPDSVPDSDAPASASSVPVAANLFHVTREETAPFPGDWAPLRGKSVRIVSVEKINETQKDAGPQLRLEFAKSVLDKDYAELAQKPQELAGVVVIFDAVDGGMLAATFPTLQQWKAGKLSDAALWHQCFFDPPETFNATGASASQ